VVGKVAQQGCVLQIDHPQSERFALEEHHLTALTITRQRNQEADRIAATRELAGRVASRYTVVPVRLAQ
jgi:hypothetical protein